MIEAVEFVSEDGVGVLQRDGATGWEAASFMLGRYRLRLEKEE